MSALWTTALPTAVFAICAALIAFAYVGYPLAMLAMARWRPCPLDPLPWTPRMDVLLVVHNGAAQLADKLHNLLALDYPAHQLRIQVVCDGCDDDSERIARGFDDARIHVHAFAERRGKSACIARMLPQLDAALVLFCDVRQRLDANAARALAAILADPDVGAVSGELVLEARNGYGRGVDAYWRYEKLIRRLESASGSIVGVTGALYAARREALPTVPAGVVLDDMWIPLGVTAGGYRVVFTEQARAHDLASDAPADEERRKRRTLAGNFQLLRLWPQLALPGAHPLAWRLWGHKWLRLLVPWCLLAMLASNLVLVAGGATPRAFWIAALLAQLTAYALAVCGRRRPALATRLWPVRLATAFFSLNYAAALALVDFLRDRDAHLWRPTPDQSLAP